MDLGEYDCGLERTFTSGSFLDTTNDRHLFVDLVILSLAPMRIFIIMLLMPFVSSAQLTGNLALGGEFHSGNYKSYSCNVMADIKHDTGKIHYYISPSFKYTEKTPLYKTNLVTYERETYVNSGLSYYNDPCNKVFLFSEFENSVLRKIDERVSLGIGYGRYATLGRFKVSLSEVVLPEYYVPHDNGNYIHTSIRSSTRLKIEANFDWLHISTTTLFQPAVATFPYVQWSDNICARSVNIVTADITDHLQVGFNYTVTYDTYAHLIFEGTNNPITDDQVSSTIFVKYKFP